jgi:hypothetical protein
LRGHRYLWDASFSGGHVSLLFVRTRLDLGLDHLPELA